VGVDVLELGADRLGAPRKGLPPGACPRLISAGIVVLAVGLSLGALSGDW